MSARRQLNGCDGCPALAIYFGPFGNACEPCAMGLLATRDGCAPSIAQLEQEQCDLEAYRAKAAQAEADRIERNKQALTEGIRKARELREAKGQEAVMP
jgi:hypothetical protein